MHISIPVNDSMELIDATEISPLISHCQVKVCYVSDKPNRNGTVITKELATEMGRKLPGSPVVGYYNESDKDFEGHNREVTIGGGKFKIVDATKPYGFVPTDAKVWFQKFSDDTGEHEYLVTECYLWTSAYPEVERVLQSGNNQSMELSEENSDGTWTNVNNNGSRIFIYNEALIEKLCILGENVEPCFEGAQFKTQFSLEEDSEFRTKLFSMMEEIQNTLKEGGSKPVEPVNYAVEIGSTLWDLLYEHLAKSFPGPDRYCSKYHIYGVYEEGDQKFMTLTACGDAKLYRLNFVYTDGTFEVDQEPVEVTQTFTSQFSLDEVQAFETQYAEKKKQDEEPPKEDPKEEPAGEEDPKDDKKKYSLEEIPEYVELKNNYDALQTNYEALQTEKSNLENEINSLKEFKLAADRKDKQAMIDSFYMLNDEDKKDVVDHMDTYSLDDIEAKLSIICVRNKVNFSLDQEQEDEKPVLFNLKEEDSVPAWIQAVRENTNNQ